MAPPVGSFDIKANNEQANFYNGYHCSGCAAKIRPALNSITGIKNREINTGDPAKILTVETDGLDGQQVIDIVNNAGFRARFIK